MKNRLLLSIALLSLSLQASEVADKTVEIEVEQSLRHFSLTSPYCGEDTLHHSISLEDDYAQHEEKTSNDEQDSYFREFFPQVLTTYKQHRG